jgi:hypothetical protein
MGVRGHVDLLKEHGCAMMANGSAKTFDTGRCADGFCNVQSAGCFHRTLLDDPLFTLLVCKGPVERTSQAESTEEEPSTMSDENSIERSIRDDIISTGFPTEIVAASVMQSKGWGIIHNPSYWDESGEVSREFDIRAYKRSSFKHASEDYAVGVYLIVECKKSEKPWVFFATPEEHYQYKLGELVKATMAELVIFSTKDQTRSYVSDDQLRAFHHYFRTGRLARTFYEPFKGQERAEHTQMIYSAVMSVVNATLIHVMMRPVHRTLHIYYPLVVFNGRMFEAEVKSTEAVDLHEASHVQLSFNYTLETPSTYRTIWRGQQRFVIDFVHLDHLADLLSEIDTEREQLVQLLQGSLPGQTDCP